MQYINALIELVPVYVPLAVMFAGLLLFFPLRAWFYGIIKRIRKSEAGERSPATDEPVTVVICCRDEGDYLERNLPAILGQRGVKFEVVVVDDCSTDSTPEVLKRYEKQYPNLKHTFVPKSARYVSHEKLAVTLGVKAAKYEWIVLTRADCVPAGDSWLYEMSCCFAQEKDIVLGYSNFHYDGSLLARRAVYERIFYQLVWYNSARRRAVGGDGCNMAFRRSVFMANNGYASMLDYIYGADDLLVNSLSCRNRTAVCCSAAAIVEQQERLSVHEIRKWKMRRVAAQRQMSRKERICFLPVNLMNLGVYLLVAGGIISALAFLASQHYVFAGAVCGILLTAMLANILMFRRVTTALGAPLYVLSLLLYDIVRPISYQFWKLKCHIHRNDFNRKI